MSAGDTAETVDNHLPKADPKRRPVLSDSTLCGLMAYPLLQIRLLTAFLKPLLGGGAHVGCQDHRDQLRIAEKL